MKFIFSFFFCFSVFLSACSSETEKQSNTVSSPSQEIEAVVPTILEESDTSQEEEQREQLQLNNKELGGEFELPLIGSGGFVAVDTVLLEEIGGRTLQTLSAGQGFYILQEENIYWEIMVEGQRGWVNYQKCFVNLPDLIPSIIYENPYASTCFSCSLGKDIPNVTGFRLYEAMYYNARLGESVYVTPVLYEMAKKINKAQESALLEGNSLYIYECFRPSTVQKQLVDGLSQLVAQDIEVKQALTTAPWSLSWFVSTGISSHQRGRAVDLTLVTIEATETRISGDYSYEKVTEYKEHLMPTAFDELSPLSATFSAPVSPSGEAWKQASYSKTMTESAILLQKYCTEAGLTPLASEWWHFSDTGGEDIQGNFTVVGSASIEPVVSYFHTIPPLSE